MGQRDEADGPSEFDVLMAHMDVLFEQLKTWLIAIVFLLIVVVLDLAMVIGRL